MDLAVHAAAAMHAVGRLATYRAGGTGSGVPFRVRVQRPVNEFDLSGRQVYRADAVIVMALISDISVVSVGDTFQMSDTNEIFEAYAEPLQMTERVYVKVPCVPVEAEDP